jgi:hypothetical protein
VRMGPAMCSHHQARESVSKHVQQTPFGRPARAC